MLKAKMAVKCEPAVEAALERLGLGKRGQAEVIVYRTYRAACYEK